MYAMELDQLQHTWDSYGKTNPMWAVLTDSTSWQEREFFDTGTREINAVLGEAERLGFSVGTGRALDFGCGVGRLSQALCERFESVCGIDIAPSMIEAA